MENAIVIFNKPYMSIFERLLHIVRRKESFPSNEIFSEIREKYISYQKPIILTMLQQDTDFVAFLEYTHNKTIDVLQDELHRFASILAEFQLGLALIHKRLGINLKQLDIIYSVERIDQFAGPFSYISKDSNISKKHRGKFLLHLKEAYGIFNNEAIFQKVKDHWQISNITLDDLFFLAGVEEAAHRVYDQKMNKLEKIANDKVVPSYHITDLEYRALSWKLKVIKKYFPQYIMHMRTFLEKQRKIRNEYLQA